MAEVRVGFLGKCEDEPHLSCVVDYDSEDGFFGLSFVDEQGKYQLEKGRWRRQGIQLTIEDIRNLYLMAHNHLGKGESNG